MIILFYVLIIISSCNSQTISTNTIIASGDMVTTISDSIWVIFQDRDNHYWFGSNGEGVYRYDGKTILQLTTKNGLSNDSIRDMQQDIEGNMYFSTMNGICKFDGKKINLLPVVESKDWKLAPDDLWFKGNSEMNGVYRWDGHSLYHLKLPKNDLEDELISLTGIHPWSNYGVYTIYKDSKGNLWFGTSCFGALRYDGKSLTWISEKEITFRTDAFGVRGIIEDEEGWMWLTNTLYRYAIIENKVTSETESLNSYKKEKGIGNGECDYFQSIVKDDQGKYWMVTYLGGVYRYDPGEKKMTHFPVIKGNSNIALVSIYKDKQGVLWLGTQENGVYRFNGNAFERFKF